MVVKNDRLLKKKLLELQALSSKSGRIIKRVLTVIVEKTSKILCHQIL